ncbi:MFS transporter [Pseudomonas aeruginosa]|uniref:MFS transporter n=1 Tax=Pseudomonas aeruginosa TaxID=287 RepID=UPI000F53A4A0|nr:MFS transporter [Pseudomonas aeruginosa]RQF30688.1 MFS transporter [Pseudomonas aeruginosa]
MNNHNGTLHRGWQSLQRWRIQIFVITWLAYAAFYFTRKAFSVAKLGIAEDPSFELDKSAMADLDALYLAAYAVGQFMWGVFADRFGTRVVVLGGLLTSALAALVMGTFATLPIFAACMVVQGLAQSTGWSGLCKNIGAFFATYFFLQRNRPQDVGLPPVEAEAAPPANAPRPSHSGALLKALRNPHVLVLGLAYFLLKPARYAILLWGPVIIYERMPEIGKVASAIVPSAFEVAGLAGPILIGLASDKLFGARRMPACVLSLAALTVSLALFVPAMQSGSLYLVVGLLFMMGVTLYGPDSMISGAAAIDFGTSEAAGTATGFVNGCGSVGAILGGLLPGYFDTLTVFFVFTATALLASLLLVPFWNSRPGACRVEPKAHAGGPLLAAGKPR